ncbi:unnamed protein product [Gongylonema pulchrum]|uniref:C-type lectin domain-containing protein n=1 Tax=Gongylonema pulchrum TaxID=637853 RepID=A0A183D4U9_9BILA|nr:unnamed protein product [Gongylonema pulchrum]
MKYNKTGGPYWIGVRKLSGTWMVPMLNNATAARYGYHPFGYQPAVYTNWRSSQPDGCCGRNVTCVLANLKNGFGQWDDAFCDRVRTSPAGVVCQRYAYQPV